MVVTMQHCTSVVLHAIWHIKPRLLGHGGVANPRDTARYRCGLRLAMTQNPSVLYAPSSMQHCTRGHPSKTGRMQRLVAALHSAKHDRSGIFFMNNSLSPHGMVVYCYLICSIHPPLRAVAPEHPGPCCDDQQTKDTVGSGVKSVNRQQGLDLGADVAHDFGRDCRFFLCAAGLPVQ